MQMSSAPGYHECCCAKGLSLKSIFIGALVGLGLSIIIGVFTAVFHSKVFLVDAAGLAVFSSVSFSLILLSTIIAHFVGGWVAAYSGQSHNFSSLKGVIYGFSAWIVGFFILVLAFSPLNYYFESQVVGLYSAPPAGMKASSNKSAAAPASNSSSKGDTEAVPYSPYGLPLFMIFVFLCVGGVSGCVGGYAGTKCRKKEESC